jgi:hypothetical protein
MVRGKHDPTIGEDTMSRRKSNCIVDGGRKAPAASVYGVECTSFVIREGKDPATAWKSGPIEGDRRAASRDVIAAKLSSSEPMWAETIDGAFVAGDKPGLVQP